MSKAPYSEAFLRNLKIENLDLLIRGASAKADKQTAAKQPIDPAIETLLSTGHKIYLERTIRRGQGQIVA